MNRSRIVLSAMWDLFIGLPLFKNNGRVKARATVQSNEQRDCLAQTTPVR
jgi:hypothetical protein